jgi:hypothetical protein
MGLSQTVRSKPVPRVMEIVDRVRHARLSIAEPFLAGLAALWPISAGAQVSQEFGPASFVAPRGWSLDSQPRLQVFTRITGRDRCMLVVTAEEPSPPGLDAAFAAAWRTMVSGASGTGEPPASVERTSPSGSRYAVGEGDFEDGAGNRLAARLHLFPLGVKSQWIVLIGSGPLALATCEDDWESFFRSLRFRSAAAGPATPARPPPAAAPSGGREQFQNISFLPPRGWTVRRTDQLVELSATDVRGQEKLHVLLLPGRVSSASLERELEAAWLETRSLLNAELLRNVSGQDYDPEEGRSLAGVEYVRGKGGMRTSGTEWDVSLYVLRAADRVERVAVVASAFRENLSKVSTANNPRFSSEIRRLVFGLKFANQPERSLPPARLRPGGIVGVWAGLGMSFGRIKTEFAIFFDNGLAYFGPAFPTQGLHQIDPVAEQPEHRRNWGTYSWTGRAGVLTMPYGAIPLLSTGPALELTTAQTPHRYIKLVMPSSSRLDGTWCYGDGECLRLSPDGGFEDNGAVRIAEHSVYASPQSPAGGAGTYTLLDHTLHLVYDTGQELWVAFPGLEDGGTNSPSQLRLGWNADLLTRRTMGQP